MLCWMIDVFLNPHDFLCTFESSCISRHVPKGSSSSFPYGNERECWSKEKSWLDFLPSSDFSCDLFYGLVFYVFLSSRRKSSLKTDERHLYDPSIEGLLPVIDLSSIRFTLIQEMTKNGSLIIAFVFHCKFDNCSL